MKNNIQDAWVIVGDFDDVLNFNERLGSAIPMEEIAEFRQCLRDCSLYDAICSGPFFIWSNKKEGEDRIFSKIDKLFVNEEWKDMFPHDSVTFLPKGISYHCPCVVRLDNKVVMKRKHFRFFNMWAMDPKFQDIVDRGGNWRCKGLPCTNW